MNTFPQKIQLSFLLFFEKRDAPSTYLLCKKSFLLTRDGTCWQHVNLNPKFVTRAINYEKEKKKTIRLICTLAF